MAVSVETLDGLERRVTVSVPAETMNTAMDSRLKKLSNKVKIAGFRPGKAPTSVVKQRYTDSIRQEVIEETIQSTLYPALQEVELIPAGTPVVGLTGWVDDQPFSYTLTFEVFPETVSADLEDTDTVELVTAQIKEKDVDLMLEQLREQNKTWVDVSRPVVMGDKVLIDSDIYLNDAALDGGSSKNHEVIVGSAEMMPGFADHLIGAVTDKPVVFTLTMPDDFHRADLAGQPLRFNVLVKQIAMPKIPELDQEFINKFTGKDSTLESFRSDITQNMVRELDLRVEKLNRESIFDAFKIKNPLILPKALVDNEIENLKHEMYHRLVDHPHSENEKIPDFPREMFVDEAQRRVHLGLLFADYVKKHALKASKESVDAFIERLASAYEDPNELRAHYARDAQARSSVEAYVLEEVVAALVVKNAKVSKKTSSYDEVIHPKNTNQGV